MATKSVHPANGLQVQIDELDALLDRLLQLPLGSAPSAAISPMHVVAPTHPDLDSSAEWLEEPILLFEEDDAPADQAGTVPLPRLASFVTEPSLPADDLPGTNTQQEIQDRPTLPCRRNRRTIFLAFGPREDSLD